MKRCANCNDFSLYDDEIRNCPVCGNSLVAYIRKVTSQVNYAAGTAAAQAVKPNTTPVNKPATKNAPAFETRRGRNYIYRGMVTELSSHSRLHSSLKKLVNSIFLGEPYQLSNTSHNTIFRITEFGGGVNRKKRDVIFYGDVEGRFYIGDDVTVTTTKKRDRYVVKKLYINESETYVHPAPQVPELLIRLLFLIFLIIAFYLVNALAVFVLSGGLLKLVVKILSFIINIVGIYILLMVIISGGK